MARGGDIVRQTDSERRSLKKIFATEKTFYFDVVANAKKQTIEYEMNGVTKLKNFNRKCSDVLIRTRERQALPKHQFERGLDRTATVKKESTVTSVVFIESPMKTFHNVGKITDN